MGKDFGLVFAFNTLGAAGAVSSARFPDPAVGLQATTWIAAGMNLGIGSLSLLWARSWQVD